MFYISIYTSVDIIFHNFSELHSTLFEKRYSSRNFLFLRIHLTPPPPYPLNGQNPPSVTKVFCRCSLNPLVQNSVQQNYIPELYPLYSPSYHKMFHLISPCLLPPPCMDCSTPSPKPTFGENLVDGGQSEPSSKKMLIPHTRKIILTKKYFSCNHPIQALFIAVVIAVICFFFFNFRLYIQIYHANSD